MSSDIKISTPAANRKELAEAFGSNQSAVRRIEAMTKDITVTLPTAVDGAQTIAEQALALAEALQQVAYVLATPSSEVPNASVIRAGTGITINIVNGVLTVALSVPVTVANGGTGLQTLPAHGVAIGNGTQPLNFAAPGTAAQVLMSNGATADPSFQATVNQILAGTGISVSGPTGNVTVSLQMPVTVANGGTGATTPSGARGNLSAAASGANSDITSLSGLTTALSVAQGGTGDTTLTQHGVLLGQGASGVTAATIGTAGRVLTDNGAGVDPSFQVIPSQLGRLLNVQVFTANATYTPTTGTNKVIVEVQGPGGGGGAVAATGAGQSASGSGGGGGAYAKALISSGFSGVAVTVPAGGAGGVAGSNGGTAGTAASFGSFVSCPGGVGGNGSAAVSAAGITQASGSSSFPTFSGATQIISAPGCSGNIGMILTPGSQSYGGAGGMALMGSTFQNKIGSGVGINAPAYGEGGGGANNAASLSAAAGGNGGPALVVVWELS